MAAQVAGIVKAGDFIDEGAGPKFVEILHVIHGNGHVIGKDAQERQVFFPKNFLVLHIDHLKDADHLSPDRQGQGDDGLGGETGDAVHLRAKAAVPPHIRDEDGLPGLGHRAGDAFPHFQAHPFQVLGIHPHRHGKEEFLGLAVQEQKRPVIGGDKGVNPLQHRVEEGLHVIGAHQHLREFDTGHQASHLAGFIQNV